MLKNHAFLLLLLTLLVCCVNAKQRLLDERSKEVLKSKYDTSTILVSTIDGYLTAIDVISGEVKWRYNEGPVLKSPKFVQSDFSYIPDPQTGELYAIVDRHLNKLPFTIPQLVSVSPCKSSDGILYSGYKKDVWIAINSDSGVHHETVPPQTVNSCPVGERPETIFIGRTEYKITMSDKKRASRFWEVEFVDYSSHLLPEDESYPFHHFHSSSDGRIVTFFNNSSKEVLWNIDLKSVIVNMYLLKKDGMHKLATSTSVASSTFNVIEEDASSFISPNWNDQYLGDHQSDNKNLMQTLFIGETEFGYYALRSFVDKKANVFQLKTLGPLLLDGLTQPSNYDPNVLQPRLPEDIGLQVSVYQTTSGEFLLLGHHEMPPLLLKRTIDGNYFPHLTYSNYLNMKESQRLLGEEPKRQQIAGPPEEDDSWEQLLYKFWKKSPQVVITIFASFFFLIMFAVYHYARYSVLFETRNIASGSQPPSHNPTNSSSRRIFEPIEGSTHGHIQIGKLSYNTQNVLGSGCGGTKVFKGSFDGRDVAIKRVISDQTKLLEREVQLLRKGDAHHNVIRYFCSEMDETFSYLALELCDCSLDDYVRKVDIREQYRTDPKELLRQATDGISHLHGLGIIHRDLKPQNILLSVTDRGGVRAKISDFGLCKLIKLEHASVSKASGLFGTDGWIAPEVLRTDLKSINFGVDVFSLGCIFYYVISGGTHPFGVDALNRQMSIRSGNYNLKYLISVFDYVSINVIEKMIEHDPKNRPSIHAIANHPIFWSKDRQLQFFMDVSDRIEKEEETSPVMRHLESEAHMVVKSNWIDHICQYLKEDLCRHRSYLGYTVKDLLRAMRNKKHHYRELTEELRHSLGPIPDKFVSYFTDRFPHLLIHCYKVMALCGNESIFFTYYPEESKSFCGRLIQEQINSGFMTITRSPQKNAILKRQNLTTQSSPQVQQQKSAFKPLPADFDPSKPPPNILSSNWRAESASPPVSTQAPPGFEQQSSSVQATTEQHKPRRRRRHKKTANELFEALSENVETLEGDEEDSSK